MQEWFSGFGVLSRYLSLMGGYSPGCFPQGFFAANRRPIFLVCGIRAKSGEYSAILGVIALWARILSSNAIWTMFRFDPYDTHDAFLPLQVPPILWMLRKRCGRRFGNGISQTSFRQSEQSVNVLPDRSFSAGSFLDYLWTIALEHAFPDGDLFQLFSAASTLSFHWQCRS